MGIAANDLLSVELFGAFEEVLEGFDILIAANKITINVNSPSIGVGNKDMRPRVEMWLQRQVEVLSPIQFQPRELRMVILTAFEHERWNGHVDNLERKLDPALQ